MMKTKILFIILFLSGFTSLYAQSSFYYYKGKKVGIELDRKRVVVIADKAVKSAKFQLSQTSAVSKPVGDTKYNISILELKDIADTKSYQSLISGLEGNKNIVSVQPCFKTREGKEIALSNYLYIKLKEAKDITQLELYAKKLRLEIVERNAYMPLWYTLRTTAQTPQNTLETANFLFESKLFAAAAPDFMSNDLACVNDPSFSQQWGLNNTSYPDYDVSVCQAWPYATGSGIKIAILDQGIELTHQDLAANIYPLSFDSESGTSPSQIFGDHATHCAGIAAAVRNNNLQIAGVAPAAKLISISNSLYSTANSRIKRADGINWAWKNGADILSNSWGSSVPFEVIEEALDSAFYLGRNGRGTVILFAAGNDYNTSGVSYPANCRPYIIAVGAITSTGQVAAFSNRGAGLDVVAPGSNILSTVLNNGTGSKSGTSMACPHVAGIAALVLQKNPSLSSQEVNNVIEQSAKKIGSVTYDPGYENGTWNSTYGYGLADAYTAVINTPAPRPRSAVAGDTEEETRFSGKIESIAPNPANDRISVRFSLPAAVNSQLQISPLLATGGTSVYNVAGNTGETTIDISSLPPGVYRISLTVDGIRIDTKKFIKQ